MSFLELASGLEWIRILAERRNANVIRRNGNQIEYEPIPPVYTSVESNVLLVGTQSNSAKPYWFLGASVSQYLFVPPLTTLFPPGVQISEQKKVRLNRLSLITFTNYSVSPYLLLAEIPYWLEDIYIEIWQWPVVISDLSSQMQEIQESLNRIENKIDRLGANPSSETSNVSGNFNDPDSSGSIGII